MDAPAPREEPDAAPEDVEALGVWLDRLRRETGVSLKGLAKEVGVDRTAMRRWLRGDHEPGALALLRIFDALGVKVEPPPHGHFAQTTGGVLRSIRRDLLGDALATEDRVRLNERIASSANVMQERQKVASELGIAVDDLDGVLTGRPEGGRLGALEARVDGMAQTTAATLAALAVAIDELSARLPEAKPGSRRRKAAG